MFSFMNFSSVKNTQAVSKTDVSDDDYVDIGDDDGEYVNIPSFDSVINPDFDNDCVIITKIYEIPHLA